MLAPGFLPCLSVKTGENRCFLLRKSKTFPAKLKALHLNCSSHSDYQNFLVENLRKYYPDPNVFSRDTWDIIERFWNLDKSKTA